MEVFEDKLNEYSEVDGNTIKRSDHFFYSQNKYQEEGRKLVYGVCSSATKGRLTVNGYVPKGQEPEPDPWVIDVNNKFKEYRFYVKPTSVRPTQTRPKKTVVYVPDEDDEIELPDHLITPKAPSVKLVTPKVVKSIRKVKNSIYCYNLKALLSNLINIVATIMCLYTYDRY
jgi:hypothetical protein